MKWHEWSERLGVELAYPPDLNSLIVAGLLIVGAVVVGWLAGRKAGPPLARRLSQLEGKIASASAESLTPAIRYGLIILLLLIAGNAVTLSPLAKMLVALVVGLAAGLLIYRLVRVSELRPLVAAGFGVMALVIGTAGTLGGMTPLIDGLNHVGFSVGRHRFSVLTAVNSIVIVAILYIGARTANHIVRHLIGRTGGLDATQRVLVQKLAGIGVIVVAVLLGIDMLGIDLTALTVFSGALGLAVGFGLQKTFGNLIAGLILLMDRSVKPGDVIVVGDTFGAVGKIGVRAVSVVTRDGKEHLIPNEQLMTEAVENWSYSDRNVRIHIPVGIAYGSDIALAQRLMIDAATQADRVLPDPKPSVWLKGFGDSSVDHEILAWIGDPELGVGSVRSDILNRIWRLFAEHQIEIPFPQRDIHFRTLPAVEK